VLTFVVWLRIGVAFVAVNVVVVIAAKAILRPTVADVHVPALVVYHFLGTSFIY